MNYFIKALQQYADFSGRARRKEYWMFVLFYMIIAVVASIIDGLIAMPIFTAILSLALFIPSLSLATRRLHDTGRSGWWQLIALIPLIGAVILIIFFVQNGQQEDNFYGFNPKEA
ncbi:DUF805 domain-containing protein [Psychromonas aquimarina]|uniref:DUF805 domain-containing protein n=1 Tax=Psychromonas aquimarina TaxID=444919 RepID=UPI000419BEBE|nr:DUF805 domain-containing protein [Psychromonas aquimarina]